MSEFDNFWEAYPKRKGANPKAPAYTKWTKTVASGVKPEALIAAARQYAEEAKESVGTSYIAQTVTWLNQRRWEDYATSELHKAPDKVFVEVDTPQWEAWRAYRQREGRQTIPKVTNRQTKKVGWWFETESPPSS